MSDNSGMISDEAVEAAAHIIAQESLVNAAMDGYGWDPENDSPEPFMPHAREQARRYLEAAAPHIAMEAWAAGHDSGFWNGRLAHEVPGALTGVAHERAANPHRSQE